MALDDFFERMEQEVRDEIRKRHEQEQADRELDQRCRDALRPYARQGMPFGEVVGQTNCPGSLHEMYQELLAETEGERQKEARQQQEQEDLFLKGFLSDI